MAVALLRMTTSPRGEASSRRGVLGEGDPAFRERRAGRTEAPEYPSNYDPADVLAKSPYPELRGQLPGSFHPATDGPHTSGLSTTEAPAGPVAGEGHVVDQVEADLPFELERACRCSPLPAVVVPVETGTVSRANVRSSIPNSIPSRWIRATASLPAIAAPTAGTGVGIRQHPHLVLASGSEHRPVANLEFGAASRLAARADSRTFTSGPSGHSDRRAVVLRRSWGWQRLTGCQPFAERPDRDQRHDELCHRAREALVHDAVHRDPDQNTRDLVGVDRRPCGCPREARYRRPHAIHAAANAANRKKKPTSPRSTSTGQGIVAGADVQVSALHEVEQHVPRPSGEPCSPTAVIPASDREGTQKPRCGRTGSRVLRRAGSPWTRSRAPGSAANRRWQSPHRPR